MTPKRIKFAVNKKRKILHPTASVMVSRKHTLPNTKDQPRRSLARRYKACPSHHACIRIGGILRLK